MSNNKTKGRFAPKLNIKKGDSVQVIAGNDKGTVGTVLAVMPSEMKAIVEGVRLVKKHVKATQQDQGGIQEMSAPIHISNLALIDPGTNQPTRVGRKIVDGVSVRVSKKSGKTI